MSVIVFALISVAAVVALYVKLQRAEKRSDELEGDRNFLDVQRRRLIEEMGEVKTRHARERAEWARETSDLANILCRSAIPVEDVE